MQHKLIEAYEKQEKIDKLVTDIDSSLAFQIQKVLNDKEPVQRLKIGERFTSHQKQIYNIPKDD